MRLFIGLAIPQAVGRELEQQVQKVCARWSGAVRSPAAADLHVTLRFLGEMPPERVAALREVLEEARFEPIAASLTGVGVFRGAGAIYAEVQAEAHLQGLQEAVSESLAWRGVPRELREFRPHVTLARRRHGLPQHELDLWNSTWTPLDLLLTELVLYRSVSTPDAQGGRYHRLHEVQLTGKRTPAESRGARPKAPGEPPPKPSGSL